MTIAWDDLPALASGAQWNITTAVDWLTRRKTDPWVDYWKTRQTLTAAMKTLGFEPGPGARRSAM